MADRRIHRLADRRLLTTPPPRRGARHDVPFGILRPNADRPVLVTGCSSGSGEATALHLVHRGWTVYASARQTEALSDLVAEGCRPLALDVTDEGSMRAAVDEIVHAHGAIHALVNNAGYGLHGSVETLDMGRLRQQFETNVFGLVRLTQLVLPGMRERRRGRIVNLSSMGGRVTLPGGGAYHATKYAVEALSDALRFEVRPFGVHVSLVEPGPVRTRFGDTALGTIDISSDGAPAGGSDQAASTHDPYGAFELSLHANIASAYDGPMASLASSAERVAAVIAKAITAARPRARYPVGPMSRTLLGAKRVLPTAVLDALWRSQYTSPSV